ncbi:MAG: hypothetical protein ACFBWO_05100 [Paracoccaceae bacterium]
MRPSRRLVLAGGLALAAGAAVAHTPYGQWVVYRRKHLLIGAHRGDARTYDLAKKVTEVLGHELPEARARVARGPRPQRIASLMGTGQLLTAVLAEAEALAMLEAAPPFDNYRPVPLRRLVGLEAGYSLHAGPTLPDDHAWLVAAALAHAGLGTRPEARPIALHAGAAAFWHGEPRPG